MPINSAAVLVGLADQKTTGMVMCATLGTTLPTDATTAPESGFTDSGYVTEDGVKLSTSKGWTELKEMNGNTVRRLLKDFTGTVELTLMQSDVATLKQVFGDDNVTVTNDPDGMVQKIHVSVGTGDQPAKAWIFNMKDGDSRIRLVIPNGQNTADIDVTFAAGQAVGWPLKISANDDGTGNPIHIYIDEKEAA